MLSFTVVSLLVTYTAIPREMSILRALLESLAVWSARVNVWYIIAMHKHQKIVSTLFIVPLSLSLSLLRMLILKYKKKWELESTHLYFLLFSNHLSN